MGWAKVFRWRTFYFKIYKWTLTNTRCNIIYQQRALCYNFDTKEKLWTITTENTSTEETIYTCQFIFSCSGYYNYAKGIPRIYRSIEVWRKIIHPQKWPENLNVVDKTIIVIGSGATAVTIELAAEAKMVTMLQRSPTYIAALPNKDKVAARIKRLFPR
jgi:cation diffusion facilitator CzcD-associated flavoprotein CzcO